MPALKNPKHEAFAQAYVRGKTAGNGAQSYLAAGFKCSAKSAGVNASKLLAQASVRRRVEELRDQVVKMAADATAKAVERHGITIEGLIEEADQLMRAGRAAEQIGAAVSALVAKAKLAGLWIERAEQRNPDMADAVRTFVDKPPAESYEQWAARRKRELGK